MPQYKGRVKSLNPTYCHIKSAQLAEDVFLHQSKCPMFGELKVGSVVMFDTNRNDRGGLSAANVTLADEQVTVGKKVKITVPIDRPIFSRDRTLKPGLRIEFERLRIPAKLNSDSGQREHRSS